MQPDGTKRDREERPVPSQSGKKQKLSSSPLEDRCNEARSLLKTYRTLVRERGPDDESVQKKFPDRRRNELYQVITSSKDLNLRREARKCPTLWTREQNEHLKMLDLSPQKHVTPPPPPPPTRAPANSHPLPSEAPLARQASSVPLSSASLSLTSSPRSSDNLPEDPRLPRPCTTISHFNPVPSAALPASTPPDPSLPSTSSQALPPPVSTAADYDAIACSLLPSIPSVPPESREPEPSRKRDELEPGEIDGCEDVRLELVLDLDHTLVHTIEMAKSAKMPPGVFNLSIENRSDCRLATRARDGLTSFLLQSRKLARLHVYTMGSRSYTRQVLAKVDPSNELIVDQVLCRKDGREETFRKSISHIPIVSERQRLTVILDDREDAWDPMSRSHLLPIQPFQYFKADGGLPAGSSQADVALFDMLGVLRDVRQSIARGIHQDVPQALVSRRREVLAGVQLVFSGNLLRDAQHRPERSLYWRLAQAFGATCHLKFDSEIVTHVVSPIANTNTVAQGLRSTRVFTVHVNWLLESCARWFRQTESSFLLSHSVQSEQPRKCVVAADGSLEGVRKAVEEAVQHLIPASLSSRERLNALIMYLVTYKEKAKASALIEQFDRGLVDRNEELVNQTLERLTSLVGRQALECALLALGFSWNINS